MPRHPHPIGSADVDHKAFPPVIRVTFSFEHSSYATVADATAPDVTVQRGVDANLILTTQTNISSQNSHFLTNMTFPQKSHFHKTHLLTKITFTHKIQSLMETLTLILCMSKSCLQKK
mgnify:CR=1 FL=1